MRNVVASACITFNHEETNMDIREVKRRHADELMALPNVTGVGVGERDGSEVIKVFVVRKLPLEALQESERVPGELEGVPCDVEEMGVTRAYSTEVDSAEAP